VFPHLFLFLSEISLCRILSRIGLFVVEVLHESVITCSQGAAKERSDPVDPVIPRELRSSDSGTEATGWV
jgi:hypothetical protein